MSSHFFAFNEVRTVTADNEDPFYPASNLLEHPTYKEFRSQATSAVLVFDLQNTVPVDSILLCGSNATGEIQATSLLIEANTANVWTAPAFSMEHELTLDNQLNNLVYLQLATQTFRYWRVTVQNPTGPYAGLSNIFIGARTELAVDLGYKFRMMNQSDVTKGRYGQRFIDKLPDLRMLDASMSVMNLEERDLLAAMTHKCSTHTPLWMVLSPSESLYEAGYFYFSETPDVENQAFHLYNTGFKLEEVV